MQASTLESVSVKTVVDEHNENVRKWSVIAIVGMAIVLPMVSYTAHWLGSEAVAQEGAAATNPRSNYWRAVKEGVSGYSAVSGPESNVLIQMNGTGWQQTRDGALSKKLPWIIAGVAGLLLLFHLFGGRSKLDKPRSGRKIKRWSWLDRLVHWITAISFIALAITGISMLIGKTVLIPILGKAGFATWAQLSMQAHNILGPVFAVGITSMIVLWVWYNFPTKVDMAWLKAGGGIFNKKAHPTGIAMVAPIYGYVLPAWADILPWVSGSRADMQQANLIHSALAIVWTAIALGHIYIGTAGTEGAFEGMASGYVSEEWAVQHHDLWAKKMLDKGKVVEDPANGGTAAATPTS